MKEIILATDADGPGVNLMHDLALRLGKARCKWLPYPKGCKDLNEAFQRHGAAGVKVSIARAQFIRVEGVYRLSELPPLPEQKPYDIGIPVLLAHYNIRGGDFSVVTGIPSHGKSSFINEVACRMADRYGWVTAFASFEQTPQRDHRRNLRTYFHRKFEVHQSPEERAEADAWIERHFVFIVPNEDDEVTLEWTLERCSAAVVQHGARIVVVDPWNELDHQRPHDMSLTEYTGFAIKQFRKFARKHEVHVIVAAHPVKQRKGEDGTMQMPSLYDISDSAHWYNKADVGIIVHRRTRPAASSASKVPLPRPDRRPGRRPSSLRSDLQQIPDHRRRITKPSRLRTSAFAFEETDRCRRFRWRRPSQAAKKISAGPNPKPTSPPSARRFGGDPAQVPRLLGVQPCRGRGMPAHALLAVVL